MPTKKKLIAEHYRTYDSVEKSRTYKAIGEEIIAKTKSGEYEYLGGKMIRKKKNRD